MGPAAERQQIKSVRFRVEGLGNPDKGIPVQSRIEFDSGLRNLATHT